jgi:YD repeat-containing protein
MYNFLLNSFKMKAKYFFIFPVHMLISHGLSSQEVVTFSYDASGNRTSRVIILEQKEAEQESIADTTLFKQDEIKEAETFKYSTSKGDRTIHIYPNPNGGMFTIGFEGWEAGINGSFKLHALNGNLILEIPVTQTNIHVDISDQPEGAYILTIMIDGKKEVWKVVKR